MDVARDDIFTRPLFSPFESVCRTNMYELLNYLSLKKAENKYQTDYAKG